MSYALLAPLLAFMAILILFNTFFSAGRAKKAVVSNRLKKYTRPGAAAAEMFCQDEDGREQGEAALRKALRAVSRLLTPRDWRNKADRELARAGLNLHSEEYVSLHIIFITVFTLAAFSFRGSLFLAIAAALTAAILPPLYVKSAQAKRVTQFNNQLSDGLTIMANSLRAGLSFLQATDTLSKEMPPPLSVEFARLLREIKLGVPTEEGLQNMLERVASRDLELLVTAIQIQRQVGGNLAEILDNIGETIRERIRLKNEVKTLTAQGRISGMIIGLLPVFIIVIVSMINPQYMLTLITHPIGPFLLLFALVSELIGLVLIRRIVAIEY